MFNTEYYCKGPCEYYLTDLDGLKPKSHPDGTVIKTIDDKTIEFTFVETTGVSDIIVETSDDSSVEITLYDEDNSERGPAKVC